MIQIVGDKLTQWDVDRYVQVTGEVSHVHFANQGDSQAVVKEVVADEVQIPTYLLQTGKTLLAYAVKDGRTLECKAFAVRKRERPADYIYEDEQRNYIYALIADVNEAIDNANKAAEELREAIENGEIVVPEGGGTTSALIVTWEDDRIKDRATHFVSDIFAHVESGGVVYFNDGVCFYSLQYVDEGIAIFFRVGDDHCHYMITVGEAALVYEAEINTVSDERYIADIGNISTALDEIIALQDELIGGDEV